MAAPAYMSQLQFSKRHGVNKAYICRLCKDGKLPCNSRGIKVTEADIVMHDLSKGRRVQPQFAPSGPAAKEEGINKLYEAAEISKARGTIIKTQLVELELKIKQGKLLPLEDVQADAAAVGEELRGKLLSIPSRISVLCEGRTAREIEEIVENAITSALVTLRQSGFFVGTEEG